jgi:MFS family permease
LVRQGVTVFAFLSRERTIAGPGYSRWLILPAALMVHLSIGEVYAFSVFKNPLVERFGVGLTPIAIIFSISIGSSTSDYIGRKPIYMMYLGVGLILYFVLAAFGALSLVLFLLVTVVILSFYGGGFATIPAYLKDMFGVAQVGAIHGRLLTAWSAAGVAGPLIINAIADYQISAGRTGADLYTLSLYIMVGVLAVGFVANLLVRPVDPRFHMEPEPEGEREEESAVSGSAAGSEGGTS